METSYMNCNSISECRNSARLIIPLRKMLNWHENQLHELHLNFWVQKQCSVNHSSSIIVKIHCLLFVSLRKPRVKYKKSTYFNFMVDLEWYGVVMSEVNTGENFLCRMVETLLMMILSRIPSSLQLLAIIFSESKLYKLR